MNLYHIGDHFPAGKAEIDAIRSLTLSVTDIGAEISGPMTSCFPDTFYYCIHQLIQVDASRMTVSISTFHNDLTFSQIFLCPAGPKTQWVQLWSKLPHFLTD